MLPALNLPVKSARPGGTPPALPPYPLEFDPEGYLFGRLTPVLAALLPESETRRAELARELQAAGYYRPHAPSNLAALRYLLIVVSAIGCLSLLLVVPKNLELPLLVAALVLPAVGWALPRLYIRAKGARRRREIEQAMPDLLDMLSMCVSQGIAVPSAMARVGKELARVHPALHQEMKIVSQQAEIGSLAQALKNLAWRIEVTDVQAFTTLLIQAEKMGSGIAKTLAEYSDTIRENLKQRAEENGNRAAFRLLFPTVLCLLPAVYLILLGPAIVELSSFMTRDDQTIEQATQVLERGNVGFRRTR
jgi:tight adherence protein C